MVFSKRNLSFLLLLLSGRSTHSARVALETSHLHVEETQWGRSCASLETRFQNQQGRLAETEGASALVRSVSLIRTLRRANARNCEWATNGELDTSAAAGMAAGYFRQSPCFEQANDAFTAAQTLPEEERENAMQEAVTVLLSAEEGCAPSMSEAPELNESDEELEEEIDDDTDEVMDDLAASSGTSLIQQEQNPLGWLFVSLGGWQFVVATIVFGVLLALFCGVLVHMIIRIFRWIRCKMFGNSCSEYAPAGWVQVLVGGGCGLTGLFLGPFATLFATAVPAVGAAFEAGLAASLGR